MMIACDEKENLVVYKQTGLYGSLQSTNSSTGSPRKVIYCVHGRPSAGCCTVSEGEYIDSATDKNSPIINYRKTNTILTPEHCHRDRNNEVDKKARRKLILASILCVFFMLCEIIGGVLSSSLAIATDAAHLLTDFASFMISLFSLWMANRPATKRMSFGWYRAEVIGALTSVLMIWVVTGVLVYIAIQRCISNDFEIEATIMVATSAFGVGVNLVMGLTLHQHGHSHGGGSAGHGHSHDVPKKQVEGDKKENKTGQYNLGFDEPASEENVPEVGVKTECDIESNLTLEKKHRQNINVRAAFIHVIGDFLQSIGVLVASLVIYFKPEWNIVDPICTFLFSVLVLGTTFAIIKDALLVLMEGMPKGIEFMDVMNTFLGIDGVVRVHNLRIWALSLDKTALSAHLAIKPGVSPQNILQLATSNIHEKYDFFEMTLQIEEFVENMENCNQCKLPSS